VIGDALEITADPRIVDRQMQRAEPLLRQPHRLLGGFGRGHIVLHRRCLPASLFDGLDDTLRSRFIDVGGDDVRALPCETERHCRADPRAGPSYDCRLALELTHRSCLRQVRLCDEWCAPGWVPPAVGTGKAPGGFVG